MSKNVTTFKKKFIKKYSTYVLSQFNNSMSEKQIKEEIQLISNKWSFFQFLMEFIRECSKDIFFTLLPKIKNINNVEFILQQKLKFKKKYFVSLIRNLSDTSLSSLPKTTSKKMINAWFLELKRKKKKFRVFFLIGGIDCNLKKFKIDNVHYFDGRKYHFKEGTKFDLRPGAPISINEEFRTVTETYEKKKFKQTILEKKRNNGRAFVDVLARDAYSAIEIAKNDVKKTFDDLVFASTSNQKHGFQPQLPMDFVFIENDNPFIGYSTGPRENDSEMLFVDDTYDKIIPFYDKLETNPSVYGPRLSSSLDWYHRGQWAQTAHEKFVSHWIALEQLILKQIDEDDPKSWKLMEYIPKLTVMWRKGFRGYSIGQYFCGIEKELRGKTKLVKFLNSNKKFKGWKYNRLIILEHINLLESVTTGETKKCVQLIQKELKQKSGFRNAVRQEREDMKFKIAVLIAKRNEIFHEGVSYSQELELLSKELKKIVVDVIKTHLEYQYATSLKQMIREANRPIQV